ncbi:hypothetical protein AZ012_002569 [Citrobacter amalonaticus]|nr:hypothetical protein AZ012_002569 [Citrobacter amalonaticus]
MINVPLNPHYQQKTLLLHLVVYPHSMRLVRV